jgi:hypothetical protein
MIGGALALGGCATVPSDSAALAPPKNYKQLVAAKLRQMEDDPSAIQYVGITRPQQMFVGILAGGTRPAVCVQLERPNIFGMRAAWYYRFYFENGKVDGHKMMTGGALQQAMARCQSPLSPITHLVRTRR